MSDRTTHKTVHVVSLGCPKNLVDTELMIGRLQQGGFELTAQADSADVLLVNTCAFIESSKEESVDAILELADIKAANPGAKLVVAGCLSQRHAPELKIEIPEVDLFIGTGEYHKLAQELDVGMSPGASFPIAHKKGRPEYIADHLAPRYIPPDSFSMYLKIAEGCSQGCSFCIIPKLRGAQRSRTIDDVVNEARDLVSRGVVEVNLVAQDLTHYGEDIGDGKALAKLVRRLGEVDGLRWVRLMYAYPHNFGDDLVDALAETENACKYIDMPLQHSSDQVLKAMNRRTSRYEMETLIDKLRGRIDGLVLRTTLLVGHPGETDADFEDLMAFIQKHRFERMGAFMFSQEDGTLSARMDRQLPTAVKRLRHSRLMAAQKKIAAAHQRAMIGREVEVLIEGLSDETDLLLQARTRGQAPDIDGIVYINDAPDDIGRGQLRQALVTESAGDYDLVAHVVA
jgi:ribosomal protein S12 methylthiotransferase